MSIRPASLGIACTPRDPAYMKRPGKRPSQSVTHRNSISAPAPAPSSPSTVLTPTTTNHQMDFFWNIFLDPEATEARTESEEQQIFVNYDTNGSFCVVA